MMSLEDDKNVSQNVDNYKFERNPLHFSSTLD